MRAFLRPGDSLTVVSLDRLGRDTAGVLALTQQLEDRGVGLGILGLGLDTPRRPGSSFCPSSRPWRRWNVN